MPREVLGDLLRALGQNPTQAEVTEIVAGAPREGACAVYLSIDASSHELLPHDFFSGVHLPSLPLCPAWINCGTRLRPAFTSGPPGVVDYKTFLTILNRPDGFKPAGTPGASIIPLHASSAYPSYPRNHILPLPLPSIHVRSLLWCVMLGAGVR